MYSLLVINFSTLIGIIMNLLKLFDTHTLRCFSLGVCGLVLLMPNPATSDALRCLLCGVPSGPLWVLGFTRGPCSNVTGADPRFPALGNERK